MIYRKYVTHSAQNIKFLVQLFCKKLCVTIYRKYFMHSTQNNFLHTLPSNSVNTSMTILQNESGKYFSQSNLNTFYVFHILDSFQNKAIYVINDPSFSVKLAYFWPFCSLSSVLPGRWLGRTSHHNSLSGSSLKSNMEFGLMHFLLSRQSLHTILSTFLSLGCQHYGFSCLWMFFLPLANFNNLRLILINLPDIHSNPARCTFCT